MKKYYRLTEVRKLKVSTEFVITHHSPCIIFIESGEIQCENSLEQKTIYKHQIVIANCLEGTVLKNLIVDEVSHCVLIVLEHYVLTKSSESELNYSLVHEIIRSNRLVVSNSNTKIKQIVHSLVKRRTIIDSEAETHQLLHELLTIQNELHTFSSTNLLHVASQYVERNYHLSLSREELARQFGLNPQYFSSYFKKEMGVSYSEFVTLIRLNKAKELLLTTHDSLEEIAYKIGYPNGSYVSKKFKQHTGVTVSEFRAKKIERIVAFQFIGVLLALQIAPIAISEEVFTYSELLIKELGSTKVIEEVALVEEEIHCMLFPTYYFGDLASIKQYEIFAPTLFIPWASMNPIEEVLYFGHVFHKRAEAEQWVATYLTKVRHWKEQIKKVMKPDETVILVEMWEDGFVRIWNQQVRGIFNLYEMLQLRAPLKVQKEVLDKEQHVVVPEQLFYQYAADHIFIVASEEYGAMNRLQQSVQSSTYWENIEAVQQGQVYFLKLEQFRFSDGVLLEKQLDIMATCLLNNHMKKRHRVIKQKDIDSK